MNHAAPGKPGIQPRWTSSAKIGVGTAMTGDSNVWFTISHGIINEVYYPRIDMANTRDMGLIVTDGREFFSEEKRHAAHYYALLEDGVPAYKLTNICNQERYRIEKTVITDPHRNVLLQEIQFFPLKGSLEDYHLYVLLSPHIANAGYGNSGWVGDYKGIPMMFANRNHITLALACSVPFLHMSCGYAGVSDIWQDLQYNKRMTTFYCTAEDGNIALGAEINLKATAGKFVLALSFAPGNYEAGIQARASLMVDFPNILSSYMESWQKIQSRCIGLSKADKEGGALSRISTAVLKTHQGKHFVGSIISSLSIPWGTHRGDNDIGGYHLIWPRDQVETSLAFLAAEDYESARQILFFLMATQENDGHWPQCFWEDGSPYWHGLQMDETALPILLADNFRRLNLLDNLNPWQMVSKAARFIILNGPATQQDRWEENSGFTPYTIAAEIAALLAAADFFDLAGKSEAAEYLRDIADWWNYNIEHWMYVKGMQFARKFNVEGYYVRISPTELCEHGELCDIRIPIKNRPDGQNLFPYYSIVSVDALALVKFGLRDANDPRILNTVKVIDALLKTETTRGPIWHRYNEDGYGEHMDGSPYNGTGIGRGWPLLVGERAHYELAKGNKEEAIRLLRVMASMAGVGGLMPEQIWDAKDIPEKSLFNGHSTGSAKPLVWAHAEYVSLLRSIRDNKVFSTPPQTVKRYIKEKTNSKIALWRFDHQARSMPIGKKLRIQAHAPAVVHWSTDEWKTSLNNELKYLEDLDLYYIDLPVQNATAGHRIEFTFFWPQVRKWEGTNFEVALV